MTDDQKETAVVVCSAVTVAILAYGLGKVSSIPWTRAFNRNFEKALEAEKNQK